MKTVPAPADIRAALFDLDGTLIETQIDFPAMTRAMLDLAAQAGVSRETVHDRDILGIVDAAVQQLREREQPADAFRERAFAILEAMERTGCAYPTLLPGTRECLHRLKADGILIGIVTRNCRAVSAHMLHDFSLTYDSLLTRDDVALTKPNPEHLWDALKILGCAPWESIMVGDHWMDIRAGNAAGCAATVGVLGRNGPNHFAPCPPEYLVQDLSALGAIIRPCDEAA